MFTLVYTPEYLSAHARIFLRLRTCSECFLRIRMFFCVCEPAPRILCACARFSACAHLFHIIISALLHVVYSNFTFLHLFLHVYICTHVHVFPLLRIFSTYFLRTHSFFCTFARFSSFSHIPTFFLRIKIFLSLFHVFLPIILYYHFLTVTLPFCFLARFCRFFCMR